jgi:ABC-type ATPase with predicted acetyltransferase domain
MEANFNSNPLCDPIITGLKTLLSEHAHKRVIVVGATCTGKTTMLKHIPGARDQDEEVFARMTKAESDCVCQTPWTPEIGEVMTRLVRQYVISAVGKPVFGTVVIDCDLIIELQISDALLRDRVALRQVQFSDAKNMQQYLHEEVVASGKSMIYYSVG